MKKGKVFYIGIFSILLLASCKIPENDQKKVPQLTAPEISLILSDEAPKSTVIISWTASKDADNYSVIRMNIRDGVKNVKSVGYVSKNEPLTIKDDCCESDTEYFYVVQAEANGETYHSMDLLIENAKAREYTNPFTGEPFYSSDYYIFSDVKSIRTQKSAEITLDYPKNVTVKHSENIPNALTVCWDPVEGATEYEVYFNNQGMKFHTDGYILLCKTKENFCIKEHLFNEQCNYFKVRAIGEAGYSLYSAQIEGRVPVAENISKDKALEIKNGEMQYIYSYNSYNDFVWFKCTPEQGIIKYVDWTEDTLSIFSEDGKILASGLPLYLNRENDKNNLKNKNIKHTSLYLDGAKNDVGGIMRDISSDIEGFSEGMILFLRISKTNGGGYLNLEIN